MPAYFILAQSEATAKALEQVLALEEKLPRDGENGKSGFAARMADAYVKDRNELDSPAGVLAAFRRISSVLEQSVAVPGTTGSLCETIVLVDQVNLQMLNPIKSGGWNTLIAMLILAFPELRFLFGICSRKETDQAKTLADNHALAALFSPKWEPIFDSTGLRNWVRARAKGTVGPPTPGQQIGDSGGLAPYLPMRIQIAAAVDDESSYAYFHGYTAYRFGFRSHVITDFEQFTSLFGNDGKSGHAAKVDLIVDDLFLNFPDREPLEIPALPLSDLRQRAGGYPRVSQADHWLFVTTGQRRPGDGDKWQANLDFLGELRKRGQHNTMLFKPTSGIFDLWDRCGLFNLLPGGQEVDVQRKGVRRGRARGFEWPLLGAALTQNLDPGHSAPGRLLEISTTLIARAGRMLTNVTSVTTAVRGAVLATDALELIGPRTPTTSLEALSLKHQFEALAECQFNGVEYDFDLRKRFNDIESEADAIKPWFNPKTADRSLLNAQLAIVSRLVLIFRNCNQFDEEHACLNKVRDLHRQSWLHKESWVHKCKLHWLIWPVRWYFDCLLKSLVHFAVAIAAWLVLLSLLYVATTKLPTDISFLGKLGKGFEYAYTSFFPMQPPQDHLQYAPPPAPGQDVQFSFAVEALAILGGFLHLGAFASHLYSKIARK